MKLHKGVYGNLSMENLKAPWVCIIGFDPAIQSTKLITLKEAIGFSIHKAIWRTV